MTLPEDLIPRTSNKLLHWVFASPHYVFKETLKQWKRLDFNPQKKTRRIFSNLAQFCCAKFLKCRKKARLPQ